MTDDTMDVDPPPAKVNAMSALMANAKGKAKAETNGSGGASNGEVMTDKELRDLEEREGLPW